MTRRGIRSWLVDRDGVLVDEEPAVPVADQFMNALHDQGMPFLVCDQQLDLHRRDLAARLRPQRPRRP